MKPSLTWISNTWIPGLRMAHLTCSMGPLFVGTRSLGARAYYLLHAHMKQPQPLCWMALVLDLWYNALCWHWVYQVWSPIA